MTEPFCLGYGTMIHLQVGVTAAQRICLVGEVDLSLISPIHQVGTVCGGQARRRIRDHEAMADTELGE
jgi:hypothetical protein